MIDILDTRPAATSATPPRQPAVPGDAADPDREDDRVWKALAEPTRRAILDLLAAGPVTTGDVVAHIPDLCRTAVMKHLDVLEDAGLVAVVREGRVRWNHLNPLPIQRLHERWVAPHVRGLAASLSRLKDHVEGRIPPARKTDP